MSGVDPDNVKVIHSAISRKKNVLIQKQVKLLLITNHRTAFSKYILYFKAHQ